MVLSKNKNYRRIRLSLGLEVVGSGSRLKLRSIPRLWQSLSVHLASISDRKTLFIYTYIHLSFQILYQNDQNKNELYGKKQMKIM